MNPSLPQHKECSETGGGVDDEGFNAATEPLLLRPAINRTKSTVLDELSNFRISLKWCALDHSTCAGMAVSYANFIFLAVVVPITTSLSIYSTEKQHSLFFNRVAQLPESALAAVSFFTLAGVFRRYGLRQLLLLDGINDDPVSVCRGYSRELNRSFRYLGYILLPSFLVELAHKTVFFSTISLQYPSTYLLGIPWVSIAFFATIASWVYRTGVFLLVCILFHLTCKLQILRLEELYKMFESQSNNVESIFNEHMRIKGQLKETSHQYRIFIIASLVIITISHLGTLLLILATRVDKTFCNSGDLAVCSIVQVSGFLMCLIGAAKITHRGQRVISIATRWNLKIILSKDHGHKVADGVEQDVSKASTPEGSSSMSGSRQALVMYLQHNGGGITLYGFALDRGLLHTIFAFELTLVLWILSKAINRRGRGALHTISSSKLEKRSLEIKRKRRERREREGRRKRRRRREESRRLS